MKRTRAKKSTPLPEPRSLPSRVALGTVRYSEDKARDAYFYTLLGCTLEQLAQIFEVEIETVALWQNRHPEFHKAIARGRDLADAKVAHALYQSAIGYSHPETVVLNNKIREFDDKGNTVREYADPVKVEIERRYPPNVTAAIKWLKARKPGVWSDRIEVKGNITMHHQVDLSDFSMEELEVLSKLGQANIEDVDYQEQ
jgi:hypothetical protein